MDRWLNFVFDDDEKWPRFNLMLMMTCDEWEIVSSSFSPTISFWRGEEMFSVARRIWWLKEKVKTFWIEKDEAPAKGKSLTHTRNDRSKIVSPRSQFLPSREWVAARGRKWRHHRSRKGGPFESWQVAKEPRRRERVYNLTQSFLLCKNLLFLPSNLLASWQTIPKTFLLAANSQRNEVVEFKLSRGLYMYINSFSLLPFLPS